MPSPLVFAITLESDGAPHPSKSFIRLPPPNDEHPYVLRFVLAAGSPALHKGSLLCNYPIDDQPFERQRFLPLEFIYNGVSDAHCQISIKHAGAFEYYMEYCERPPFRLSSANGTSIPAEPLKTIKTRIGYVVIDPCLSVPPRLDTRIVQKNASQMNVSKYGALHMDSICMQTVVPKWMGQIHNWKQYLKETSDTGYNMVHFVPMQKRGSSDSPYSIYDQLSLSDDLFPAMSSDDEKYLMLRCELDRMKNEDGLLAVSDVVWNHTAHNSGWLAAHPESGYNLVNSPHLRPAYELDEAILEFSRNLEYYQLSRTVSSFDELQQIMSVFHDKVLSELKLWEFYVVNVEDEIRRLAEYSLKKGDFDPNLVVRFSGQWNNIHNVTIQASILSKAGIINKDIGKRFGKTFDTKLLYHFFLANYSEKDMSIEKLKGLYKTILDEINLTFYQEYDSDLKIILDNIRNRLSYERLATHGPHLGPISIDQPLVSTYFTRIARSSENVTMDKDMLILANNGWIWNADPLIDFAGPNSKSYLLREVIPWGDCVKLRYGRSPDESPWLWNHMLSYTKLLATYFDGLRIDNCHSTPIHVAQYFLDHARQVRPNLYVFAELFTGSEDRDITFVSKLGINSLIREAMNAWDAGELSRLIHRYGGLAVGSLTLRPDYLPLELVGHCPSDVNTPIRDSFKTCPFEADFQVDNSSSHRCERVRLSEDPHDGDEIVFQLRGSTAHALFMDCTHDNETPFQRRTGEDSLSTSSLVCMATCAIGSVKGYDEMVPTHLNIVKENRKYSLDISGIKEAKRHMQKLHYLLGQKGYCEMHVHREKEFICVTRQHPFTHHGYILIANTGFHAHKNVNIEPITLRNMKFTVSIAARINTNIDSYRRDDSKITGVPTNVEVRLGQPLPNMFVTSEGEDLLGKYIKISPKEFPAGSILVLDVDLLPNSCSALEKFSESMHLSVHGSWYLDGIVKMMAPDLTDAINQLSLIDLNVVLFRSDAEERDFTVHHGVYNVPNFGPLSYAGLQGYQTVLKNIVQNNELGHPFCENLRQGFWAMDYIVDRLHRYECKFPSVYLLRVWFDKRLQEVKSLPNFLVPKYFTILISTTFGACVSRAIGLMSPLIRNGKKSVQMLALGSVQLCGIVSSTSLYPNKSVPSIAAGLPHFATNHMRCWGRDIFISLSGLYILTGRCDIAREHLLAFASVVKHGLVPNLLDAGRHPRYNARDATWFFLQALQDYCKQSEEGVAVLDAQVKLRFPNDRFVEETDPLAYSRTVTVREVVFDILQKHACGISFEEWNAGSNLDHAMSREGFKIDIRFEEETGFLLGGNKWNCGTWMDKMGDSSKAGTFGVPATPRDGAAIEITGLLKSTLRWLTELSEKQLFNDSVTLSNGSSLCFREWAKRIDRNFEKCFFVDRNTDHKRVVRENYYKDTYLSTLGYTDFQLRPNFAIAMVVAPELFNPVHARHALSLGLEVLKGPLGFKTLDPADFSYRGYYDNSNDSDDAFVAHGFNYHQGPEWLWVAGYFFRAMMHFSEDKIAAREEILHFIQTHRKVLMETNPFAGLPELTNENGELCHGSCPTQAWSSATLLDLYQDFYKSVSQ